MRHHTIQIYHQRDATVSHIYYLTFMCGSTCFGRLPAHHQEHTTALGASGLTVRQQRLERCWSWSGWLYLPDHDQQRSRRYRPTVKPEAPNAVVCS